MKVRFELLDLDAAIAKKGDFERALMCYVRSTSASEQTDTREIAYWRDIESEKREGIRFYALKINGEIAGYAQSRYISASKIVILDYLCIDPQQESNAAYFSFIELFCNLTEASHTVLYIVTEVNFNLDAISKDDANRYWLRILELAGFKVAQTKYLLPSLIVEAPSENRAGALLIRSNERSPQLSNKIYISILHSLYFLHYVSWYEPFKRDINSYQAILKKEIARVATEINKFSYVKLNGSLKHAGLVVPEQPELSFSGKEIYLLLSFALIFMIIVSAGIAALSVYAGLGSYTAIFIIFISMTIFAGLIGLFMPSRIEVLKILVKPISKLFSGL